MWLWQPCENADVVFDVRFEVFKVMTIQVEVIWIVMPCNIVVRYQSFGGPCSLLKMEKIFSETLVDILMQQYMTSQSRRP
jgi:hypothetical protein